MAAKKKATAPKPPAEAALSKHQAFAMERLHRSKLATAAYNPRVISDEAKSKLKRNLSKVGLLEPLIWNRTTGTLLGGHQRLACLDALEGSPDYLLDVAVVELSEREEREQNIALNSPMLQGEYDMDMLAQLLKTPELELEATGFELADVQVMFDDPELATLFAPNEPTKKALSDVEKQQEAAKTKKRIQQERSEDNPDYVDRQDTEVNLLVVFRTREEREAAELALGYEPGQRYVDGARLATKLEALAQLVKPGGRRSSTAEMSPWLPAADAPKPPKRGRSDKSVHGSSGPKSKPSPTDRADAPASPGAGSVAPSP